VDAVRQAASPLAFTVWSSAREAVIGHARDEAPLECCGLLLGGGQAVEEAVPARNVRRSTTAYLVDPADHFAAIRRARAQRRAVVGAYHSHPRSPAMPSPVDLRDALYREFLYLIVSLADPASPEVRGYMLEGDAFVPVALVTVGSRV
jgi:proteasome lid subunit RPN8/RPN11